MFTLALFTINIKEIWPNNLWYSHITESQAVIKEDLHMQSQTYVHDKIIKLKRLQNIGSHFYLKLHCRMYFYTHKEKVWKGYTSCKQWLRMPSVACLIKLFSYQRYPQNSLMSSSFLPKIRKLPFFMLCISTGTVSYIYLYLYCIYFIEHIFRNVNVYVLNCLINIFNKVVQVGRKANILFRHTI